MKFFCFSITFVLVNVLASNDAEYKKQVAKTNAAIEIAYNMNDFIVGDNYRANGLEFVIEKMVNNTPSFHVEDYYECFARINAMIVLPDKTDIIYCIPGSEYLRDIRYAHLKMTMSRHTQNNMKREIEFTLGITIPEAEDDQTDFRSLNLTTLAEQRRRHVESALKNIFRRKLGPMYNHFIEQLEIRDALNSERLNLTALTEERRVTGASLGNSVRHVLGTVISEVEEDQSRSAHGVYLLRMCRLMGLYMSTKFPRSYIINLQIDPINNTCSLDEGTLVRRLKKINGVWWQISSIA